MEQFEEPGEVVESPVDTETVKVRSSTTQLSVGDIVDGRYKVLAWLGKGGVGSVYRVEQILLRKQYALKTLLSVVASDAMWKRFLVEAQASSKLEHPNLARAVDFGVMDGNQPYFVMDLVEGQTLGEYLKNHGPMTVETAMQIFAPISSGLAYAHQEGVIHRDIKPGNIVLVPSKTGDSQFVPKVVDFGIAKLHVGDDQEEQALTKSGEVFGTPLYMSPEQCAGIAVDNRTDIYSLGCVLFESLTGAPPFRANSSLETMLEHRNKIPLSLKESLPDREYPQALEHLVAKMLAKDPEQRYSSCQEVAQDLKSLQQNLTVEQRSGSTTLKAVGIGFAVVLLIALITTVIGMDRNAKTNRPAATIDTSKSLVASPIPSKDLDQKATDEKSKNPKSADAHETFRKFLSDKDVAHMTSLSADEVPEFINDESLVLLKPFTNLDSIDLSDHKFITANGLSSIVVLPKLKRLDLNQTNIGDDAVPELNLIRKLKRLELAGTPITDVGVQKLLGDLPLERLNLKHTKITNRALKTIARFKQLRTLTLDNCNQIGDDGIHQLADTQIQSLSAKGTHASNSIIHTLKKTPNLSSLVLTDNKRVTDSLLLVIIQKNVVPKLTYLDVRNCAVSKEVVDTFRKFRPKCKVLAGVTEDPRDLFGSTGE